MLSRRFGLPWVAEYRDGWSHYLYSRKPKWREALDEVMEDHYTKSATGIVTVSEPWAEYYRARFPLPAISIYNGYDQSNVAPHSEREPSAEPLTISYFGQLYEGVRDPTVLYQALIKSGLSPAEIKIRYFGPTPADVVPLATRHNVMPFITIEDRVAHNVSLQLQRASDVLLLLQPPEDPANVPAKTFEYFAARRPILGIGLDDGIPAQLIRDRNAGFYNSDPDQVALALRKWVEQKQRNGCIADLPSEALAGLSRDDQFKRLRSFLVEASGEDATQTRARSSLQPAECGLWGSAQSRWALSQRTNAPAECESNITQAMLWEGVWNPPDPADAPVTGTTSERAASSAARVPDDMPRHYRSRWASGRTGAVAARHRAGASLEGNAAAHGAGARFRHRARAVRRAQGPPGG